MDELVLGPVIRFVDTHEAQPGRHRRVRRSSSTLRLKRAVPAQDGDNPRLEKLFERRLA
jgi:hypothetical protein